MDWETLLGFLKQVEKDTPNLLKRKVLRLSAEEGLTYLNLTMLHDGKTIMFVDDYDSFLGKDADDAGGVG